jgi:hypothetical protein
MSLKIHYLQLHLDFSPVNAWVLLVMDEMKGSSTIWDKFCEELAYFAYIYLKCLNLI